MSITYKSQKLDQQIGPSLVFNSVSKFDGFDVGFFASMNCNALDRFAGNRKNYRDFGAGCHFDAGKNLGKSILKLNYGVINDINVDKLGKNIPRKARNSKVLNEMFQDRFEKRHQPDIEFVEKGRRHQNNVNNELHSTPKTCKRGFHGCSKAHYKISEEKGRIYLANSLDPSGIFGDFYNSFGRKNLSKSFNRTEKRFFNRIGFALECCHTTAPEMVYILKQLSFEKYKESN